MLVLEWLDTFYLLMFCGVKDRDSLIFFVLLTLEDEYFTSTFSVGEVRNCDMWSDRCNDDHVLGIP